jgi:hypothetical protein
MASSAEIDILSLLAEHGERSHIRATPRRRLDE